MISQLGSLPIIHPDPDPDPDEFSAEGTWKCRRAARVCPFAGIVSKRLNPQFTVYTVAKSILTQLDHLNSISTQIHPVRGGWPEERSSGTYLHPQP